MTIQAMARMLVLLFIALVFTACATDEEPVVERPDEATTAALAELEERIEVLEDELADAEAARDRAKDDLKAFRGRFKSLKSSVKDLRSSLADVRSTSATSDEVAGALSAARAVAADLEVLEERYDYHLRRYHGGGR